MAKVLAEFSDAASLVEASRLVKRERRISYETLDEVGGLSRGHSSKLLAPFASRKISNSTFLDTRWLGLSLPDRFRPTTRSESSTDD